MNFGISTCPKCRSPRNHHRFPFKIKYEQQVAIEISEGLIEDVEALSVTCGRCSHHWYEPTTDADHNKQVADLKEATNA